MLKLYLRTGIREKCLFSRELMLDSFFSGRKGPLLPGCKIGVGQQMALCLL